MMEFFCLMSDGLIQTGIRKFIKCHINTTYLRHGFIAKKRIRKTDRHNLFWTSLKFFEYFLWIQPRYGKFFDK